MQKDFLYASAWQFPKCYTPKFSIAKKLSNRNHTVIYIFWLYIFGRILLLNGQPEKWNISWKNIVKLLDH